MKQIIHWDTLTESWIDSQQNNITLLRIFQNDTVWTLIERDKPHRYEFADEREGIAHMVNLICERDASIRRRRVG